MLPVVPGKKWALLYTSHGPLSFFSFSFNFMCFSLFSILSIIQWVYTPWSRKKLIYFSTKQSAYRVFVMKTNESQIAIWFSSLCILNFIFVFCGSGWILCYGIGVCGFLMPLVKAWCFMYSINRFRWMQSESVCTVMACLSYQYGFFSGHVLVFDQLNDIWVLIFF